MFGSDQQYGITPEPRYLPGSGVRRRKPVQGPEPWMSSVFRMLKDSVNDRTVNRLGYPARARSSPSWFSDRSRGIVVARTWRGWNPTPTVSPPACRLEEQGMSFTIISPSGLNFVPSLSLYAEAIHASRFFLTIQIPLTLRLPLACDGWDSFLRSGRVFAHSRDFRRTSDGSEASLSGRTEPSSGAESSSERRGDPNQFVAREDTIADVVRDEDLPDNPEAVLNRRTRPPAPDEAGVSRWQDAPELPILPEVKGEMVAYDPAEGARLLQLAIQGAMVQRKKTRAKKVKKPDPPGSTLSTSDSLRDLKARFNFSERVTLRLPTPSERADGPPEGFFTLYEGFFYFCFLWFPIPRPIIEYLWSYKLALAQITTRGLRHLIGILIRGIETYNNIGLDHLRNLLEIRRVPSCKMERYYISPRPRRRVIGGFPSKDEKYTDHFFFVALDEDCVPEGCLEKMIGKWRKIDRGPSFLDRIPEDLFSAHEELAARKCNWLRHFSQERVEKALRVLHGVSCSTSSSSSDQRVNFLTEMQKAKMTLRERKAAERKAIEERKTLEAIFRPLSPPEVTGGTEMSTRPEATDEPEGSRAALTISAALPEEPEGIPTEDTRNQIPEVEGTSVVVGLPADGQAKSKGKRPRGEHSGDKRKRSKKDRSSSHPIYKDAVASANLIASCAWPLLPAPENLIEADKYGETAASFLKAFSSMNTMVHSYDSAARAYEAARVQLEMARTEAENKVAEAALAVRNAEALVLAEQEARHRLAEESLRAQQRSEDTIESLNRLLTEEKSLHEIEAKANAELIEALESGKRIEDEKEEVLKWKEEFGDSEAEYARLGAELFEDLKFSMMSPDSVNDGIGNRSVESNAADAGVLDQSGTNLNPAATDVPDEEQDE
ncbi:hypothetical protein ISN45_Aa08g012350 [Arabidopsis thaliana x Arabidopsis arenosa]|uniref:Uncharacterized protein n=1 Tax=Arabidopsis thaliana x Arabidopsis arenosa TaxID=1240361 RepID=A0A8T1XGC1_9BRAS|nr:hypothetical protein ISN45_Aa08g012350 [Arabidopsis thaliana x Arabidopsis arenosa]